MVDADAEFTGRQILLNGCVKSSELLSELAAQPLLGYCLFVLLFVVSGTSSLTLSSLFSLCLFDGCTSGLLSGSLSSLPTADAIRLRHGTRG